MSVGLLLGNRKRCRNNLPPVPALATGCTPSDGYFPWMLSEALAQHPHGKFRVEIAVEDVQKPSSPFLIGVEPISWVTSTRIAMLKPIRIAH